MLFNSHFFIFVFLPITLLGYFLLGNRGCTRAAAAWLSAASLFFYGWWNPNYLWLIGGSIVFNYFAGVFIANAVTAQQPRKAWWRLLTGVTGNLALLGYYKYADFFIANSNALLGTQWPLLHLVLPLAISFFTFTQIAYLVDAYHGRTQEYNFLYYLLFVTFFPHLIAGPIVLYKSLMPQFAKKETYRWNPEAFAGGLTLFVLGLCKKVIIADSIAPLANAIFGSVARGADPAMVPAWIGSIAYSLQLYFDFSGYSDMAVGIAAMFGTQFPQNFDSPYRARNIVDFWRRWHITLSTFLRDHLYIPLGGNRHGSTRRYVNLFLAMVLGGLWHGAGWTFVIWGALHGSYLVINYAWDRLVSDRSWANGWFASFAGRAVTLLAVIVGWVFFRSASVADAVDMLVGMSGVRGVGALTGAKPLELGMLALAAAIALFAPNTNELMRVALPPKEGAAYQPRWRYTRVTACVTAMLFVLATLHLSRVSEFLYFQF